MSNAHIFQSLFDLLPVGTYRYSPDKTVLHFNATILKIKGYTTKAQMEADLQNGGHNWYVRPDRCIRFEELLKKQGFVTDFVSEVYRFESKDTFWVNENAQLVLDDNGHVLFTEGTIEDITVTQTAQLTLASTNAALDDKSRVLQMTLDNMNQGILNLDTQGRAVMSNQRLREMLGFSKELMDTLPTRNELAKIQFDRGDFGPDFNLVDIQGRGYVSPDTTLPAAQGPTVYTRKTQDGRVLEVRTQALPDGGAVRTFTDVTDLTATQDALKQKQQQLTALIETIPDRIWLKDLQGVYLMSNLANCQRNALTPIQFVGKTDTQIFGSEIGAVFEAAEQGLLTSLSPVVHIDQFTDPATGKVTHHEIIKMAFRDDEGRVTGSIGIGRDVTARQNYETELIDARNAADAATLVKAQFLANMSHEIRTPMNAVIGMGDLLLGSALSSEQREFVQTICTSGESLLVLINDILDFSKFESGHLELESLPISLGDCVKSALDMTSGPAIAKALKLSYLIDDSVPRSVLGDVTRLRQIFVNLLSNAIKFTLAGQVAITITTRQLGAEPGLYCAVRDTGIGIPPDRMDRLFQQFSQVDASTTRQFGGTGLGLAITRRLIELMGGRIWVESILGQGSVFQFEIPIQAVESTPSLYQAHDHGRDVGRDVGRNRGWSASQSQPAAVLGEQLPLRVLLAEDNIVNQRVASLIMGKLGYTITTVDDGAKALAAIQTAIQQSVPFDVVLMDVQMPQLDGLQASKQLRSLYTALQRPWIIAMTANAMEGDREICIAAGMDDYVSKPVRLDALADAMRRVIKPADRAKALSNA